ncbi:hypothetical protein e1012e08.tmp0261 [Eimeria tenella]|uniref:Uncharacterized protein n=1 Tax=Eimeria tenella TaxID=5802 RepID=C8TDM3_EIMTE|nr:hypothetical protein e1012e08.tmp0261 [Eimeria tenella]
MELSSDYVQLISSSAAAAAARRPHATARSPKHATAFDMKKPPPNKLRTFSMFTRNGPTLGADQWPLLQGAGSSEVRYLRLVRDASPQRTRYRPHTAGGFYNVSKQNAEWDTGPYSSRPKSTVAERPHEHKEAPTQVIPMTNVMPGDSPFVTGNRRIGPNVYPRRTIDLSDWATVQHRLLERFDKTVSQSQLLTELTKVRLSGNPKEHTDRFAAVAERALGVAPKELADSYCTRLPTELRLPIAENGQKGQVKPLGLLSKPVDPVGDRKSKINLGEPTRTAMSVRVGDIRHVPAPSRESVPNVRKNMEELWRISSAFGNSVQVWATSILTQEAPGATTDSSRKSAESTEDGYTSDATEIVAHWWRETCTKESHDQRGALCYVGATASKHSRTTEDEGAETSRRAEPTGEQLRIDRLMTGFDDFVVHSAYCCDYAATCPLEQGL